MMNACLNDATLDAKARWGI